MGSTSIRMGGMAAMVCLAVMLPVHAWAAYAGSVDIRVAAGTNDAEERVSNGDVWTASTDLEMVDDASSHGGDQMIGLRFTGVLIPQGSTITNAYIEFTADESNSGSTSLTLQGQDADDPAGFGTGRSRRVRPDPDDGFGELEQRAVMVCQQQIPDAGPYRHRSGDRQPGPRRQPGQLGFRKRHGVRGLRDRETGGRGL